MSKTRRKGKKRVRRDISRAGRIRIGAALFLLALVMRGVYLYEGSDNPTSSAPVVDSLTYDLIARQVAEGWGMSREFFWQQFFYPFFLSIVYWLSNCSIVFARVVQILIGSVACVLTYRLGERMFGRAGGVAAGLIASVYGPLIFFEAELLAAGWAAFWAAALILLFLKTAEKKNAGLCFALGLCGALSVLTRPNFIPFLLAAGLWLGVVWIRRRIGVRKFALGWLAVVAGFCAGTIPVCAKNYQVTGRFSFLPATGGLNLYIGNNPEFEATALRPGVQWQKAVELPLRHGFKTAEERQRFFYARTLDYVREEPTSFLKGLVRKGAEFCSSREMPGHIDAYMFRKWSRLLGVLMWKVDGFGFPFGVLLPLSLLGLFLNWRKVPTVLLLFMVLYPATVILTHVEARYRVPVVIPMCVLAGGGLVKIGELGRTKRWFKLGPACVFCLALGLLCSIAGPFYSEKHIDYEAELHYVLGGSLADRGRTAEAMDSYERAIRLRPDYLDAHRNLGVLLVEQSKLKEAAAHYDKALRVIGEDAGLREGLGLALFEQGKINAAMEQYHKAIEIEPERASAHDNLGRAFFSRGRLSDAYEHFSRAVQLNPDDPTPHNNIGTLLAAQGRLREAIEHYETSLRLRRSQAWTLCNLASAFASLGEFAKAAERFEEALRIAPDDAETRFNLGLCLQQQGRISEAITEYRKALLIDPQHMRARQALNELTRSP
ncbi:MAG: tetratricopeptide repeat protein [Planctomycetota bacterium]|jgi:tetratricopeptide (TPR) repeat protein